MRGERQGMRSGRWMGGGGRGQGVMVKGED